MRTLKHTLSLKNDRQVLVVSDFAEKQKDTDDLLKYLDTFIKQASPKERVIGFDTETTGLRPESEDEHIRLLQLSVKVSDTEYRACLFDCWKLTPKQTLRLGKLLASKSIVKVGQNLKFDIKFFKKLYHSQHGFGYRFGKIFDVMLAAQILCFGNKGGLDFKLSTTAWNWLELELPKDEQLSDWSQPILFDSQLMYAGSDAVVPQLIREEMLPVIEHEKLIQACQNDFATIEPVARLEYDGFYLNRARWIEEYHKTIEDRDKLKARICELLPSGQLRLFDDIDTFNISSTKQLAERLALQGVSLPLTEKGNPSRDAFLLEQIIDDHESIPLLIKYAKEEKLLSAYGLGWLDDINKTTKRVHATFNINGALATSRFSSFDPNLQQIPRGDSRRSCFEAEKGNILIDADYSQIELRILAQFSRDPVFIAGFTSGEDFHTWTASQVFDRDIADVTKDQREFAKRLNFGLVYGIGANKLAMMLGIEAEEADDLMKAYFDKFKRTDDYLRQAAQKAIRFRKSYTATGRFVKYIFSRDNKAATAAVGRNGKNMPIQGTSAELMKRALQYLYDDIYDKEHIKLVNIVHDEIILEAPIEIKEEVGAMLHKNMEKAGKDFIDLLPVKIDVSFMDRWAK